MKRTLKRLCRLLLAVALAALIPMNALAYDYDAVTPIRTAGEFFAIMDDPQGAYRLENDIDLGWIAPLGWSPDGGVEFRGILDGNGHTIRFGMGNTGGLREYGLFYGLKQAEITDLTIDADIDVSGDLMCVGVLTVYASNATIMGVSITGSLRVTADGSQNLYVCGISSGDWNTTVACTVDLQAEISMPNERLMWYYALGDKANSDYYQCDVYGGIRLTGGEVNMRGLQNARDSIFCADLSVCSASGGIVMDDTGVNNYVAGGVTMEQYPGATVNDGLSPSFAALSNSTGSSFTGTLNVWGEAANNAKIYMARDCQNVYIEADVSVDSWGGAGASVHGLSSCTDSIMTGSVQANMPSGTVELLEDGERDYFSGSVVGYGATLTGISGGSNNTAEVALCSYGGYIMGASGGTNNSVTADLYAYSDENEIWAYGISGGRYNSFYGTVCVEGASGVAWGARGCSNSTVCADLTSDCQGFSRACAIWGSLESYYRGTLRGKGDCRNVRR